MVNFPTRKDLQKLQTFRAPYCVSIYVPYTSPNTPENPMRIMLKNLLREADGQLQKAGIDDQVVAATLKPAYRLLKSREFWPIHRQSIALFMHQTFFRYYHLPSEHTEHTLRMGRGFYLEPLLQAMKRDERYFVLVLSHKKVRLYEGDRYRLRPLRLNNLTGGVEETLNIDEYPNARELHPVASAGLYGKASEGYHQQYDISQTDKDMLFTYFRRVDEYLHSFLNQHRRPLILAGVEYLLPIYRQANTYPYVLPGEIRGNIERDTLNAILEKARQAIETSTQPVPILSVRHKEP